LTLVLTANSVAHVHAHSQCEFRTLWQDASVCIIVIIRPHRSTMYVDAAYCYRPSSMVCRSVGLPWSWALQKQLNQSRCRSGFGLRWAQRTMEW